MYVIWATFVVFSTEGEDICWSKSHYFEWVPIQVSFIILRNIAKNKQIQISRRHLRFGGKTHNQYGMS